MPAFHESEYAKDLRRTRARFSDSGDLAREERRIRALWSGLLIGDIHLPGETKASGLRFIQRMRQLPSQGVHDKVTEFSLPLEGWIDRHAFEVLWQERGELLRAIQPVTRTIELPPEGQLTEEVYPLWVFDSLLGRYYGRVERRMYDLMIGWTNWDGIAPLPAPEGTLNPSFVDALGGGPLALEAWGKGIRDEFEADFRARMDTLWWRGVRLGMLRTFRVGTRGARRERWIAWGFKGLLPGGAQLRD